MSKRLVVHCKVEPYDVYIGRGSKWGNPFKIGVDGDRDAVIRKYADWFFQQPELLQEARSLKGKVLGCWCAPRACHGDILATVANPATPVQLLSAVLEYESDEPYVELKPEVRAWLDENTQEGWSFARNVYEGPGVLEFYGSRLWFDSEDDALLFKLTWGEDDAD